VSVAAMAEQRAAINLVFVGDTEDKTELMEFFGIKRLQ